jgi:hypothetical protein
MSDLGWEPTEEQAITIGALTEDYGVATWLMVGNVVCLRDREGDEWRIAPDGDPTCLGGGMVADGPELEEEEL